MGYFKEETIKMSLICTIRLIADKLKVDVEFDSLDRLSYDNLNTFRNELLEEYNAKIAKRKGVPYVGESREDPQ
jgi:hypothetical protein